MENRATDTWQKIETWYLVLPPSRPSHFHLQIIAREIQSVPRECPVAVLGSTPEFRDLLFQLGFRNIYVLDKYESVHQQMNRMRCYSNPEYFVHGDWLDTIPQYSETFAIILSDLTSGNIPYNQQPNFYSSISQSLQKDGLFIDKVLTFQGPKKALRELIAKYEELPLNLLHINYFSCEFLFSSELLDIEQTVDTSMFYRILENEFQSEKLRRFLAESPKITPHDCVWFYGREWDQIRQYYFRTLEAVRVYEDEDYSPYYGNLKLFVCRKRR